MTFDAHVDLGYALIATPPSPATSGQTLTFAAGAVLPAAPFNAWICPAATVPTPANSECIRVTGLSGLQVTSSLRAQEGTSPRTILAGDQVIIGVTAKTLTDIESAITTNAAAIAAETTRAEAGEAALASSSALATEATTRGNADTALSTAIGNETTRAEGVEATLATAAALASEATTRGGADTTLSGLITAEATTRGNADTAETAARAAADTLLRLVPTGVETSGYGAAAGDAVLVDATAGPVTVTLPTAPADGTKVAVKKIDSSTNAVTIARGGTTDVFNKAGGSTSLTILVTNQAMNLQYAAGTAIWYLLAGDTPIGQLDARYDAAGAAAAEATARASAVAAVPVFRGSWVAATAYNLHDIVSTPDGTLQVANTAHTSATAFDPSKWTRVSDGPVATRLRAPSSFGVPMVASGSMRDGGTAGSGQTIGNYRKQFIASCDSTDIRIAYAGYQHDTLDSVQTLNITAGIEFPLGTTVYPVFFNGKLSGVVDPGGIMMGDPVGIDFKKGDVYYVRTCVQTAGTTTWPANYVSQSVLNEGGLTGGSDLSKVTTGITAANGVGMYMPFGVFGMPNGSQNPAVIVLCGDSIMKGSNDANENGFALRALNNQFAWMDLSRGGETAQTFATAIGCAKRVRAGSNGTHVVCNYGTNDVNGRTLAQLQADNLTIWTRWANRGLKCWQTTITPKTTSTDSWATTANQTVEAGESKRTAYNDWLRAGAPIDPTTKAAVAIGTSGALLMSVPGHPLTGIFDTSGLMEVNAANVVTVNGSFWKVDGSASTYTSDGLHPSTAGHILMIPAFDTTKFI